MKLVQKTSNKIILEVTQSEIEKDGFDNVWDKIRSAYGLEKFDVLSITKDKDNPTINFIELKSKLNEE